MIRWILTFLHDSRYLCLGNYGSMVYLDYSVGVPYTLLASFGVALCHKKEAKS